MMKRIIAFLLAVLLISGSMVTPAHAAGAGSLTVSGTSHHPGDTVEVTYYVSGLDEVTSMGLEYNVPSGLSVVDAQWLLSGALTDIDKTAKQAIIAFSSAENLAGRTPVFKVTYQIGTSQTPPYSAKVTMKLQAKKDAEVLGTFTAEVTIEVAEKCDHPADKQEVRDVTKPTCITDGYTGDTWCTKCNAIVKSGLVDPATGNHTGGTEWKTDANNHWHVCTTSGCNAKTDEAPHTFQWITDKMPTEDAPGLKHEECSVCKTKRSENTEIPKLDHTHTEIQHHAAMEATCAKEGNVEYWTCSSAKCSGIYYADKDCTRTLPTVVKEKDPTKHAPNSKWETSADSHWHTCNNGCGTKLDLASHTYEWKVDKEATETTPGIKHEECVCGVKRNENTDIPKLGHTHTGIKHYDAVPATCVATGTVEYWTCSHSECAGKYYGDRACNIELSTIVAAVDPNNHTGGTEVKNTKAATCKDKGYTGDTHCKSCGELITAGQEIPVDSSAHEFGNWVTSGNKKERACKYCGYTEVEFATSDGSNVEIEAPDQDGLEFEVEQITSSDNRYVIVEEAVSAVDGADYEVVKVFDITLENANGVHKQPDGTVKVKLPLANSNGNFKVFRVNDDGTLTDMNAQKQGSHMVFTTDHFSIYVIVEGTAHTHTGGKATCKDKAVCTTCGKSYGELNPNNHASKETEVRNAKEATCTEKGYTGDTHYKCCGVKIKTGSEIAAKGHQGGKATCTSKAVCEVCKQAYGNFDTSNHSGSTEVRNAKEATCTEKGYTGDTYYKCCGAKAKSGTDIAAKGHSVDPTWKSNETHHWHVCNACQAVLDQTAHNFQWITDKMPTEDATGLKHEECSVCKVKRNEGTVIEKQDHTHTGITRHAAVAATCVKEGNVEYWTCSSSKCAGKYYGDENCTTELKTITVAINSQNHTGGTQVKNQKDATCHSEGYTGDTCCVSCGAVITAGQTVPATGKHVAGSEWKYDSSNHWHICSNSGCNQKVDVEAHTYVWVVDREASETAAGVKHEECKCGSKRNEGTEIPKLDHTHTGIKHYNAVPATCVATGTVEYWTCAHSECAGKYYGDAGCQILLSTITAPVDKNNHTGKTEVKNAKAATCGEAGYTGDTYCTGCNAMVDQGDMIPATGKHTPKQGYEKDADSHWQICSVCNAVVGGAREAHTYSWIVDKAASEHATGLKHQECTVCGHETSQNTVIDKLPHSLEFVAAKPSTCTEDGVIEHFYCKGCGKYYASDNGKAGEEITKADVVIPATGHTYSEQWKSDETGHWNECFCDAKSEIVLHDVEIVGALEATETEEGWTGDSICRICGYVVAEGEVIPMVTPETEPTTEPQETEPAPTEPGEPDPTPVPDTKISPVVIVAAVAAAIAGAVAGVIMFLKKRKF